MIQTFHNFTLFRLSSFFKGFNGSTGNIDNNTVVIQKSCISPAGVSCFVTCAQRRWQQRVRRARARLSLRRGGYRYGDEERVDVAAPVRQPGIDLHRPFRRGVRGVTSWRRVYANEGPHRIASRTWARACERPCERPCEWTSCQVAERKDSVMPWPWPKSYFRPYEPIALVSSSVFGSSKRALRLSGRPADARFRAEDRSGVSFNLHPIPVSTR